MRKLQLPVSACLKKDELLSEHIDLPSDRVEDAAKVRATLRPIPGGQARSADLLQRTAVKKSIQSLDPWGDVDLRFSQPRLIVVG